MYQDISFIDIGAQIETPPKPHNYPRSSSVEMG